MEYETYETTEDHENCNYALGEESQRTLNSGMKTKQARKARSYASLKLRLSHWRVWSVELLQYDRLELEKSKPLYLSFETSPEASQ